MKTKKPKATKVGNKRKKVPSDISPSTSLPPLVEGQVRCFLRVTVDRVLWTIPKPPAAPLIRLRWWGESSSGTHFRPRDGSSADQRGVKTTARFAIRCGPKQFTSYLTDMGVLVLDVLTNPEHLPFGRVQVSGISRLSLSHSISGFFTLVSPTSEKLGELQVSLTLEPLMEAYDSCSSVHTTDAGVDTVKPALGPLSKATPHTDVLVVPSLSHPLATNSSRESEASSTANTPRGRDHLYFQETNGVQDGSSAALRTVVFADNGHPSVSLYEDDQMKNRVQMSKHESTSTMADGQTSTDILSVLLDRGSKLRNAMVVSALKSNLDSDLALKDIPFPVSKDNIVTPASLLHKPSSGKLLENLLISDSRVFPSHGGLRSPKLPDTDYFPDAENRAVELLLGSLDGSSLLDRDSSPLEFLSGGSSVLGDSELNDPLYDQSLLETLFYQSAKADSSVSDLTADEDPGLHTKKKQKKRRSSGKNEEVEEPGCPGTLRGWLSLRDPKQILEEGSTVPDLSADSITALGRIHLARVLIHSLTVPADSTPATPHKKGKPPRPHPPRRCSYFVEYSFPVAPSKRDANQRAVATEVTRVASCKVAAGVVKFHQRSVFPVQFSEAVIKHWWNTDLTFKIYSRERFQKKPVAFGRAVFPLRSLLSSEQLRQAKALPVLALEVGTEGQEVGKLKVSVELGAVSKDFSPAKAKGGGQGCKEPSYTAPNTPRKALPTDDIITMQPQRSDRDREETPAVPMGGTEREGGTPVSGVWGVQDIPVVRHPSPANTPAPLNSPIRNLNSPIRKQPQQQEQQAERGVLLHALLLVPDGKDFTCSPTPPNVYLNCKMFGSDETTRSAVSWGQSDPTFNFTQVAPVVLSPRLLERMRNNVMVIEVWRKGSSGQDQLLGLVKMPLQQFYMSFRDPKICQLLLQVQYPVVAVDSYMPVIDLFSGRTRGTLRVLLAMGLAEQIVSLQRMRDEDLASVPHPPRPVHSLDQRPQAEPNVRVRQEETTEHVFEVTVERVKGLTPLQSTVWGEADCYVQYSFPTQEEDAPGALDSRSIESSVCLRQFRTGTVLCVPDPVFGHSESHALQAPAGVPVQRLLLSSYSSQGPSARGGICFQVWCRYYYPNVRDQLVAKGLLPLSRLCAMVTMQTHEQTGPQAFSLPLLPQTESTTGHHPQPSGLLDVCVRYRPRPMRAHGLKDGALASRVIALAVQVHRAAGLQAAARAAARRDEALCYYADVGVNAYVSAHLSFLPERERRSTRVVARSFCPDFEHHTEYPCSLLVQSSAGEACSLAELLEDAHAVFSVCHRDSRRTEGTDFPASKDTVLGTVTVQLRDLIHKRTGISGWFPVCLSQDPGSPGVPPTLVGGLEVSISFAHHADRERVISAARGLGWEVGVEEEEEEEEEGSRMVTLSVATPRLWLPLHCLLLPGHRALQRSTYCYLRYRLYEEPAYCSSLRHPSGGEDGGVATAAFGGGLVVELRHTLPLRWYLREERLELQVWVAFGKERRARPHDTDRLVGSAYVDLSALARRAQSKLTVSGVYPIFRRSAPDLEGAALRVHITMTPTQDTPLPERPLLSSDSEDERGRRGALYSAAEEEEEEEGPTHPVTAAFRQSGAHGRHQTKSTVSTEILTSQDTNAEDTFTVTVTVDRAMHLSLKGSPLAERSGGTPSCCVSFATADAESPITTPVVPDNSCPVWDHQWVGRLSKEMLVDPLQTMVFKVWHRGAMERVIGFASVDLSPLLSGFQSVCGWYNITDFNGQCQGQLKVAVSPLKGVQNLRGQRQGAHKDNTKDPTPLFQTLPVCYHTSAMYTSFPAHITRYPEQRINTSPEQMEAPVSGRSSANGRHEEHVHNVRMFHQSLQEGERAPHGPTSADLPPSGSTLFSALRKNLSELDDIQRYFSRKLTTPTFSSLTEQAPPPRLDEHRDSETDSAQLLLRSSRLVGAVNGLISDLHGLSGSCDNTQGIPGQAATSEDHFLSNGNCFSPVKQTEPEQGLREGTETPGGRRCPSSSPVPQGRDQPSYTLPNTEELRHDDGGLSPDEGEEEGEGDCEHRDEEEDQEEQEYEETVIEPRTLNEVTMATDRTSPWTSLLSEADLGSLQGSLQSLDLEEQRGHTEEVEEQRGHTEEVEEQRGHTEEVEEQRGHTEEVEEQRGHTEEVEEQRGHTEEVESSRGCAPQPQSHHGSPLELLSSTPEEDLHIDHQLSHRSDSYEARAQHQGSGAEEWAEPNSATPQGLSPGNDETPNKGEDSAEEERHAASPALQNLLEEGEGCRAQKENPIAEDRENTLHDPVDIPNFFLSTVHLEASMRAMRMAPVFPRPVCGTGKSSDEQGILIQKAPRPRPSIPPPSARSQEEARRIAKIFASRFTEGK